MMVNTEEYLMRPGNWEAFLNKASYCRRSGRRLFVWVGELPKAQLGARHSVPWLNCREPPGNTLNIYKAIALLALSEGKGRLFVYLDADAWFSDLAFEHRASPEDYAALSPRAFLFGNQNRVGGPKIPMNGGVLIVRNSPAARRFLALWWWSRCGSHDQLPLWASLFAMWASTVDDFKFDSSLFSHYDDAHEFAIRLLADVAARVSPSSFDGGHFKTTGILDAPLELPGVLLLPSASFRTLPALRSDVNASAPTFCCHTRIGKTESAGQCTGDQVCARLKCAPFLTTATSATPPWWSYLRFVLFVASLTFVVLLAVGRGRRGHRGLW